MTVIKVTIGTVAVKLYKIPREPRIMVAIGKDKYFFRIVDKEPHLEGDKELEMAIKEAIIRLIKQYYT